MEDHNPEFEMSRTVFIVVFEFGMETVKKTPIGELCTKTGCFGNEPTCLMSDGERIVGFMLNLFLSQPWLDGESEPILDEMMSVVSQLDISVDNPLYWKELIRLWQEFQDAEKILKQTKTPMTNSLDGDWLNSSISDKKEVVRQFLNFDEFELIESIKNSPDKMFTKLLIDGHNYVLVETDFFENEDGYESREVEREFKIPVSKWLQANNDSSFVRYNDGFNVYSRKRGNQVSYGLALLK